MDSAAATDVIAYGRLGWKIVALFGLRPDGTCECGQSHVGSEGSRGKHPREKAWQGKATRDEKKIAAMVAQYPRGNVGLLLGFASGVIDVEYDTPEGKATADALLAGIQTPSYSSGRSVHRLFRYSSDLPDLNKVIWRGLEVRIGGGGSAAQSVLPPSRHHSGAVYQWLPGLSPADVNLAELPHDVLVGIVNNEHPTTRRGPSKARLPLVQKIVEGDRDNTMLRFARRMFARSPDPTNDNEQKDLWQMMLIFNEGQFVPPLDEDSLTRLHSQVVKYTTQVYLETVANAVSTTVDSPSSEQPAPPSPPLEVPSQDTAPQAPAGEPSAVVVSPKRKRAADRIASLTQHGLKHSRVGKLDIWGAGEWSLTIIQGDPVSYRLHVPAWERSRCKGDVSLTVSQFVNASKVAEAVLAATDYVELREYDGVWTRAWNGRGECPSLRAQLLTNGKTENPPPTRKKYMQVAEYLLDQLSRSERSSELEPERPVAYSVGTLMPDGSIWFIWREIWREAYQEKLFTQEDVEKLEIRMKITEGNFKRYPQRPREGEQRRKYCVLSAADLRRLRKLAGEDE